MNSLFVIPCYFNKDTPVIIDCIKSIKKFHPESDIVVVDSGSKDKSYFTFLKEKNVLLEDVNNKKYDTGAYWYAYEKYKKDYDYFYFLHDSIKLNNKLPTKKDGNFFSIRYFYSHNGLHELFTVTNKKNFILNTFFSKIRNQNIKPSMYGFDTVEQREWVVKKLEILNLNLPKFFVGLFGPMMIIDKSIMEELSQSGMNEILPSNKEEQKAMERIFGIKLSSLGLNIIDSSLQGDHMNANDLNEKYITKIILNRK